MVWTVDYHPDVTDDLLSLGNAEAARILRVIDERIVHGEPDKMGKPLRNSLAGCRRIRTGNTRIVYQVDGHAIRILIIAVGPRRNSEVYHSASRRV